MCFVVRGINKENIKVLGISTEATMQEKCSYDFCLLNIPVWNDELETQKLHLQEKCGIFKSPDLKHFREEEYPKYQKK